MINSIEGGRYNDQALRMHESGIPFLWWFVMGDKHKMDRLYYASIESATIHLQMQNNFKVTWNNDKYGLVPFLLRLYKYMCDTPTEQCITAPLSEQVQKTSGKRKMKTHGDVYLSQLECIHGVSKKIAANIARSYPSMKCLIKAYKNKTQKERCDMLLHINNGKKNIGKALSRRIHDCTFDVDMEELKSKNCT
jgi:ERCC4-type nuclease